MPTMETLRLFAVRLGLFAALVSVAVPSLAAADHRSGGFAGEKVKQGTVTHTRERGRDILTLSDDFQVPDAPDPHWQVVDARGTTYLLDRLTVKPGQTLKRSVVVPPYVKDVAKVQIWCAWAEALLGEASFPKVVTMAPFPSPTAE